MKVIADYKCVIGEAPLWHPLEKRLYWIDISTGHLFRYDPARDYHEKIWKGEAIGGFTIQINGELLLFGERGSIYIWKEGQLKTVLKELPAERDGRFNDVIADPQGRVFCGTMPTLSTDENPGHFGRLFRLDPDGSLTLLLEGINISNGMGFTLDSTGFYHTDSENYLISLFDYEQATGCITNRRSFVRVREEDGSPDGLTVDAEGYVWSALWGGSCVVRYTPDGQEERRITFPNARDITSLTFGGEYYRDLYVTTAGGDNKQRNGADAGALYQLRLGLQGKPEYFSRIAL